MNAVRALLAALALSLMGCGPAVRIFRGTNTTAVTFSGTGGGTQTTSTNGALVKIFSTTEPNTWDFEVGGGGLTGAAGVLWKATTNGTTVTFITGQTVTTTTSQSGSSVTTTTTTTLSGGTGTLDQTQLTLNLQGTTQTSTGGGTGAGTFTTSFAGVKE